MKIQKILMKIRKISMEIRKISMKIQIISMININNFLRYDRYRLIRIEMQPLGQRVGFRLRCGNVKE